MANIKISNLPELTTTGAATDVLPVVDVSDSTTKKIKLENLPVSTTQQAALDLKANSADVYTKTQIDQKILKTKHVMTVQLGTPATPTIPAGGSHTYIIDLGQAFEQIAICDFEWVQPALSDAVPDAVVASAAFPQDRYGGVLVANKTPGGWVRLFEMNSAELQNGSPTDVAAAWSADSSDVDAPLGYGTSALQVPLDHVALQTTPPKKLQIEDVFLSGNNLHVTIKNYDSVGITLTPYVGITRLVDENRVSQLGAVSENGVIAYTSSYIAGSYSVGDPNSGRFVRISEDKGRTWKSTVLPPVNNGEGQYSSRRTSAISLTNDGVNTFLGVFNYGYVLTGSSPDYAMTQVYNIRANIGEFKPWSDLNQMIGGKSFDWKKTSTDSCALFAGFKNYTYLQVYKSVDDCVSFGSNSPAFNDNQPILEANTDIADFQNAANGQLTKFEVKAIDENLHFVSLQYVGTPETLNNGFPKPDVFVGSHTITGPDAIPFEMRANEVAFINNVFPQLFSSAPIQWKIQGSTLGNNVTANISSSSSPAIPLYYTGAITVGTAQAQTVIQNMTFTAVTAGTAANAISIEIVGGATLGAEFVTRVGDAITIHVDDTVSTCQDVANVWAEPDVSINIAGFESNTVTTSAAQNLSGGLDGVTLLGSEVAVLASDYASLSAVISDTVSTNHLGTTVSIVGTRAETINSVAYTVVKLAHIADGSFSYVSYTPQDGGGSPIFGDQFNHSISSARFIPTSVGKYYWVFNGGATTYTPEASPLADVGSTSPNLEMVFTLAQSANKSIVLKTVDGGATWTSINEDDEFRYSQLHAFSASNDGQTLMLAAIRYWNQPGYEKWPYPIDKNRLGSDARFNISTDGGTTWRNSSGSWDNVTYGAWNPFQGQVGTGQVIGSIGSEILSVLFSYKNTPRLHRSLDSGITWQAPVEMIDISPSGMFHSLHSDSKDQFIGFFGNMYQAFGNEPQNYVFSGSVVEKFTQWEAFGVK